MTIVETRDAVVEAMETHRAQLVDELDRLDHALALMILAEGAQPVSKAPASRGRRRAEAGALTVLLPNAAATPKPPPKKPGARQKLTDDEQIAAIKLADELQSDTKAQDQLGLANGSIARWRVKHGIAKGERPTKTPPAAKPSPSAKATTGPKEGGVPSRSNRFTDEQKATAVRRARELGNDQLAAAEVGCSVASLKLWRDQGIGSRARSSEPFKRTPVDPDAVRRAQAAGI